jgi:hypothetical protein
LQEVKSEGSKSTYLLHLFTQTEEFDKLLDDPKMKHLIASPD